MPQEPGPEEQGVPGFSPGSGVAVFILDLNRPMETAGAVRSVLASGSDDVFVMLHENGSDAEQAQKMTRMFADEPRVTVSWSEVNLGFAGGHNYLLQQLALRSSTCEHVLLLNNDAVLLPGAISALRSALRSCPQTGIAGPRILRLENEDIVAADGAVACVWLMQQRFRNAGRSIRHCPVTAPVPVPFVSGACLMLGVDLFHRLGGFDEQFFAYFEDWDLCRRAHSLGYSCLHVPAAVVLHAGALTVGKGSALFHFLMTRNRVLMARKHLPAAVFLLVFLPYFLVSRVLFKSVWLLLKGRTSGITGLFLALRWLIAPPRERPRFWPASAAPGAVTGKPDLG
jgi:hypothetical protein